MVWCNSFVFIPVTAGIPFRIIRRQKVIYSRFNEKDYEGA